MGKKEILCPHCLSKLLLDEELFGQEIVCPSCNKNFLASEVSNEPEVLEELEEVEELEEIEEVEEHPSDPSQSPPPAEKKSFKLHLKNLSPELKTEPEESKEEDLVELDDSDDEFTAVSESENEDNLMEPDPGFVTVEKFRKAVNLKNKIFWRIIGGLVLIAAITGVWMVIIQAATEEIRAPKSGTFVRFEVDKGERVAPYKVVAVIKDQKEETKIKAKEYGFVKELLVNAKTPKVTAGQAILTIKPYEAIYPHGFNFFIFCCFDISFYGAILGILIWCIAWIYNRFIPKFSTKAIWKRDLIKQYFDIQEKFGMGIKILQWIFHLMDSIPFITFITHIITGLMNYSAKKYREKRFPYYDEVQKMDMEYLTKLNVLHRFGKDKTQLVSKMETLFAPAFDGVDGLMPYASLVEDSDGVYRYNLEEVTKVYTFEDQLFLYAGIWDYSLGKMLEEKTEAFFFKDITDVSTCSNYKISTKYVESGCLSMILPWFGKKIRTVYKESEGFTLTSSSGNKLSVTIGFEDAIAASGATYTHRNDNERIIHAIRKMIEEKKELVHG